MLQIRTWRAQIATQPQPAAAIAVDLPAGVVERLHAESAASARKQLHDVRLPSTGRATGVSARSGLVAWRGEPADDDAQFGSHARAGEPRASGAELTTDRSAKDARRNGGPDLRSAARASVPAPRRLGGIGGSAGPPADDAANLDQKSTAAAPAEAVGTPVVHPAVRPTARVETSARNRKLIPRQPPK